MARKGSIRFILFIILAVFIIFGGVIVHGNVVSASSPCTDKVYTSVRVNSGDSLWSIAAEYCEDAEDIDDYIDELKQINGIENVRGLKAGNYLTVYYKR